MHLITTFASLLLALKVQALAARLHNTIDWVPCEQNGSTPITCGTLTVPLDYTDLTSNKTLTLDLVKVSAVKQPKKGSILLNPGGPGESGRNHIVGWAMVLLKASGGSFDLIGFDPRGTGETIPFSCYLDALTRENAERVNTYLNSSDVATGRLWALGTIFAKECYENNKDIGQLIGTAFVARDMMQIVDALDEDGLLRYWGFSYGTVLGVTVAAMFPDRIDKIVLDGVVNPHQYYAGENVQGIADADATLSGFFTGCVADPENCDLAQDGPTAVELEQKVYDLIYRLKYFPIVEADDPLFELIDYAFVKRRIFKYLYSTSDWRSLANTLHNLLTHNPTNFSSYDTITFSETLVYPNDGFDAVYGIQCSDASLRTNNITDIYPLIEEFYATSKLSGDIMSTRILICAQWPFKAAERYEGNFKVSTRRPILFIGNTYDPVTPLASARNASDSFERSVVLQHDGYGHTSMSQPSFCTFQATSAYFENGTLPDPGTVCQPSLGLFSDDMVLETWVSVANFTNGAVVARGYNDVALFECLDEDE